jgi:hypothetical protein
MKGNLIDSVISSTTRPGEGRTYGAPGTIEGTGSIAGNIDGAAIATGAPTALHNYGTGVFARSKRGHI